MSIYAKNPIMPGFYPDPSICAVDGDYYLINSTFAYFPGLPIMHSRDLVHWEQIGNAMHRQSQLPLGDARHSAGLFAPTIRYHKGKFYVICTNVSHGGNYIVTADDPEGPWSEPYYIEGAGGIDPSLFFDEDGKCYYIGTHPNPEGCKYNGDWYIWIQELDLDTMKLVGEHKDVWNGAMRNIIWPEGPHLYKKDGYYYIMHAEGGTGPDHAVTVCRSKNIWGPYENNFCNPILTHRHLGKDYPIRYVGHADMIETPKGEWYMVMLAVRPKEGYTTMGRETFLAKVVWENGWPVVNPGVGMLTEEVEIDLPEWDPCKEADSYTCRTNKKTCVPGSSREYLFANMQTLGDEFLFLRNPEKGMYELVKDEGLYLRFGAHSLKEIASPSFIAIRQQHHDFRVNAKLSSENLKESRKAGLALVQSDKSQLRLEVSDGKAEVILCVDGQDKCVGSCPVSDGEITLFLRVNGLYAAAGLEAEGEEQMIVQDVDIRFDEAREAYREWAQETYNFTLEQKAISTWESVPEDFANYVTSGGDDNYYLFWIYKGQATQSAMKNGLMYDLSKLDCLDLENGKWHQGVNEMFSIDGKNYGFRYNEGIGGRGVYFNKRILKDAGVNPDDLYKWQASGEWTWDKFEELCAKVQKDTDNDGVDDIYGMACRNTIWYEIITYTNNGSFIDKDKSGNLVNALEKSETMQALNWALDIWDKYDAHLAYPEDAAWDYFMTAYKEGKGCFYPGELWRAKDLTDAMDDELGFVCFPKGPQASDYVNPVADDPCVIPACYDPDKAWKIAFAYDVWTDPVPEFEDYATWRVDGYNTFDDTQSVDDTVATLMSNAVPTYSALVGEIDLPGDIFYQISKENTPAQIAEAVRNLWQAKLDAVNQ